MTHFLLLFIVLFGGFLGWGLWEWKRTRYKPMLWNEETGAFEPYKPLIQSVDFAMNTQQQFIRPWERIYVDEIAAFTDKQYKYLSDKMKP